jgi:hypothetical protein
LLVSSAGYLSALIIGSFAGYLIGAWLADRIGRFPLGFFASGYSRAWVPS